MGYTKSAFKHLPDGTSGGNALLEKAMAPRAMLKIEINHTVTFLK